MSESSWFQCEDELLSELRTRELTSDVPNLPGFQDVVEVARGGQGVVYRATQLGTNRVVAIKVMFDDAANVAKRRMRFEREVELAGLLEHPNVVRLYDGGTLNSGRLFTVMEFIDGLPLNEYSDKNSLNKGEIVALFTNVCDAVGFAHRRGVIHRDLKPSNILVTKDGNPHVLDFGLARAVGKTDHHSTQTGEFLGTLAYASPEQIAGDPVAIDTRTDVYSLGVVLFRLLTGVSPYPVDGPIAHVIRDIQTVQPPEPSRIGQKSDDELDTIVLRALEKIPEDRYPSVDALTADLRRYLTGEAIEAKRHSKWYVFQKAVRRNRLKVAAAFALLILLISFSGVVTALWQRAVAEEQQTREIKIFWEDTLGSVTPSQPGEPITFREVLDEAVHWVAITTENRPEVEASLRTTIGNGYRSIGQFLEAEKQLVRSLRIRRELYGSQNRDVIQSLNAIALLRKSEGKLDEAEQGFLQTLESRERLLGKDHPDVAMSLQNLGRVSIDVGDLEQADKYFDRALEIRQRHFGSADPAVATVYFNQGDVAVMRQQWDKAEKLHSSALQIRQSRLAATHPDIPRSLIALSRVHLAAGDYDQAQRLAKDALDARLAILSQKHVLVFEVEELLKEIESH